MSSEGDANEAGGTAAADESADDRPDHGVPPEHDPYVLRESDADEGASDRYVFWADRVADEIGRASCRERVSSPV